MGKNKINWDKKRNQNDLIQKLKHKINRLDGRKLYIYFKMGLYGSILLTSIYFLADIFKGISNLDIVSYLKGVPSEYHFIIVVGFLYMLFKMNYMFMKMALIGLRKAERQLEGFENEY